MELTLVWTVTRLEVTSDDTHSDVVQTYWKVTGTDENGVSASFNGATPFSPDRTLETYVPFAELTEETVLEWIKSSISDYSKDEIIKGIETEIKSRSISLESKEFPWAQKAEE